MHGRQVAGVPRGSNQLRRFSASLPAATVPVRAMTPAAVAGGHSTSALACILANSGNDASPPAQNELI